MPAHVQILFFSFAHTISLWISRNTLFNVLNHVLYAGKVKLSAFLQISTNFLFMICSLKECSNLSTTLQKTVTAVSQLNEKEK